MTEPRIYKVETSYCAAFWNNVVILDIKGHVDANGVREITAAYRKLHESYADGVLGITLVRPTVNVGSADTHAEVARCVREMSSKLLHAAIVLEDQGLIAQLMRSFIRTVNTMVRNSRVSIAANVEEAVRTLTPRIVAGGYSSRQQIQMDLTKAIAIVRAAAGA